MPDAVRVVFGFPERSGACVPGREIRARKVPRPYALPTPQIKNLPHNILCRKSLKLLWIGCHRGMFGPAWQLANAVSACYHTGEL